MGSQRGNTGVRAVKMMNLNWLMENIFIKWMSALENGKYYIGSFYPAREPKISKAYYPESTSGLVAMGVGVQANFF